MHGRLKKKNKYYAVGSVIATAVNRWLGVLKPDNRATNTPILIKLLLLLSLYGSKRATKIIDEGDAYQLQN